jgi:hypothetical protein
MKESFTLAVTSWRKVRRPSPKNRRRPEMRLFNCEAVIVGRPAVGLVLRAAYSRQDCGQATQLPTRTFGLCLVHRVRQMITFTAHLNKIQIASDILARKCGTAKGKAQTKCTSSFHRSTSPTPPISPLNQKMDCKVPFGPIAGFSI